jgi:PEP-CTERM motif
MVANMQKHTTALVAILATSGALLAAPTAVSAQTTRTVYMTFESGATFSGDVTFTSNYSAIIGVDGVLTGYQYGSYGYVGGDATDVIDWVWGDGANYATGTDNVDSELMDGAGSGYSNTQSPTNWIDFGYNYSDAPDLTFLAVAPGSSINTIDLDSDPMVSGVVSGGSVPEPEAWVLMLLGVGLTGASLRYANRRPHAARG